MPDTRVQIDMMHRRRGGEEAEVLTLRSRTDTTGHGKYSLNIYDMEAEC